MTWLAEVLERNGIIPSGHIAEQILEAVPRQLVSDALRGTAAAVLHMRGIRDGAGELAAAIAAKALHAVDLVLRTGDDQGDELEERS